MIDLYGTGQRILLLAFDNQFSAALDQLVVFFGLQVFLPGDQLFVVQLSFLLVLPFFSLDVEVGRELLFCWFSRSCSIWICPFRRAFTRSANWDSLSSTEALRFWLLSVRITSPL